MNMNPQAIVQMLLNQNPALRNNPIISNAINMASTGDNAGLNTLAENVCRERGIDLNKAINDAKQQFGL